MKPRVFVTAIISVIWHSIVIYATIIDKRSSFILSPTVRNPSPEYVKLLNHSILFFEAQRSGKLPDDNRVSW
jgi:endoglucanase